MTTCAQCKEDFPEGELISFDNVSVCTTCKELYVQSLKEGVEPEKKESKGRKNFRIAITFIIITILIHGLSMLIPGFIQYAMQGVWYGFYFMVTIFFLLFIPLLYILLWLWGFKTIMIVSQLFHYFFGKDVILEKWQSTTDDSLWRLPYASLLGCFAYSIYAFIALGGWPADVQIVAILNILAAWCYLSIFHAWFKIKRKLEPTLSKFSLPKPQGRVKVVFRVSF